MSVDSNLDKWGSAPKGQLNINELTSKVEANNTNLSELYCDQDMMKLDTNKLDFLKECPKSFTVDKLTAIDSNNKIIYWEISAHNRTMLNGEIRLFEWWLSC